IPVSRAIAASATGHGRRASVGRSADARWWWCLRRGAGGAGALASRSAGQRLHAPIEPRPAAGASTRPPRSPPPRRAGWLPMRCWSPRHSPPSPDAAPLAQRFGGPSLGVDRLLFLAGDLDTARFGLLGDRDGQPQHPAAIAGLDPVGVQRLAQEQLPAEYPARPLGGDHLAVGIQIGSR